MTETTPNVAGDGTVQKKRGPGRPRKNETRATSRPRRTPVSGTRDILTVTNKDPNFYYRFVNDVHEDGSRIKRFLDAGYEFVDPAEHNVGENHVYRSSDLGSIARVPSGGKGGGFLYLMRQPIEFYKEDQAAKARELDEIERSMEKNINKQGDEQGQYGKVEISRS